MKTYEELQTENENLLTLNEGLALQVACAADRLEAGRRQLLAIGWDAACDKAETDLTDVAPDYGLGLKDVNPYRQPVPDFASGI